MNAPAGLTPIKQFQGEFETREEAFAMALPRHIPFERFRRVVLSAVQRNPDLLAADRASLFTAAMDAATDGLLADGREAAFVVYNTKIRRDGKEVWIKKVQFMPMIFGLLKKVRNSGELKSLTANIVYGGDTFRYWVDEKGEHIQHEPADVPDKNIFRRAYAMAITKDDGVYIAVLDGDDVEKIRNVSRSKDKGPWSEWWEEMAKKSAIRRLVKRLPLSTDLDDLMRRDDALYDFEAAKNEPRAIEAPRSLAGRLDALAGGHRIEHRPAVAIDPFDPDTGEIIESPAAGSLTGQAGEGRADTADTGAAAPYSNPEPDPNPNPGAPEGGGPTAVEPPAGNPKPPTTPAGGDLRKECVTKLLAIVTDKALSKEDAAELLGEAADRWAGELDDKAFVGQVFETARKVLKGELTAAKAAKYLEGL